MAKKAKKRAAKSAPRKKTRKKAPKASRRVKRDRFAELTHAHARAVAAGEHHFAKLLKREITKGGKRR